MSDFFATEDDYARMVQAVGPKLAKKYMEADRKRGGMNIVPAEVEFKPVGGGVGGSNVDENDTLAGGALPGADDNTGDNTDLGALSAKTLNGIRAKMSEYGKLGDEQKAFYDRVEQDLLTRRLGPSKREQYFQMASALLQPTETRGFGASLANLVPVLQQQEQQRREAFTNRADALQKLRAQQLAGRKELLGKELDTEVALARIDAAAAKANQPKLTYGEGDWRVQPGTGDVPPINGKGQYVVSSPEQAANVPKGKQFILKGGDPNDVYYGQ
jgi:hypothetical protein